MSILLAKYQLIVISFFLLVIVPVCRAGDEIHIKKYVHHHGHSSAESNDFQGDTEIKKSTIIPDPIEPVNRLFFWINHQTYRYLFHPITYTYDKVVPPIARLGIYNVINNSEFPLRFVNHLLQGKFVHAGQETEKFLINSVGGVGGVLKLSDKIPSLRDLPDTYTGQTFAKWGIPHGFYIVLPVLGPSSVRDAVGEAADYALSPISWLGFLFPGASWVITAESPDSINTMEEKLYIYDQATANSIDKYLALRSAYVQSRHYDSKK